MDGRWRVYLVIANEQPMLPELAGVDASGTLEGMWGAVGADQAGGIQFVEAKRCHGIGGSR
jgi:hypothetical protein